jgi:hypothetical protein
MSINTKAQNKLKKTSPKRRIHVLGFANQMGLKSNLF